MKVKRVELFLIKTIFKTSFKLTSSPVILFQCNIKLSSLCSNFKKERKKEKTADEFSLDLHPVPDDN